MGLTLALMAFEIGLAFVLGLTLGTDVLVVHLAPMPFVLTLLWLSRDVSPVSDRFSEPEETVPDARLPAAEARA